MPCWHTPPLRPELSFRGGGFNPRGPGMTYVGAGWLKGLDSDTPAAPHTASLRSSAGSRSLHTLAIVLTPLRGSRRGEVGSLQLLSNDHNYLRFSGPCNLPTRTAKGFQGQIRKITAHPPPWRHGHTCLMQLASTMMLSSNDIYIYTNILLYNFIFMLYLYLWYKEHSLTLPGLSLLPLPVPGLFPSSRSRYLACSPPPGVGVLLFCESDPETLWQCGLASYRALRI